MFEAIEDLVEDAVNLNYRAYPILKGMLKVIEDNKEHYQKDFVQELTEVVSEIEYFLSKLEASTIEDEEGNRGIDINDFNERKIH